MSWFGDVCLSRTLVNAGILLEKNLGGGKTIDHCFFKTIGYCFYCSFYCFFENFRGAEVVLGGAPAPCSRKPECILLLIIS